MNTFMHPFCKWVTRNDDNVRVFVFLLFNARTIVSDTLIGARGTAAPSFITRYTVLCYAIEYMLDVLRTMTIHKMFILADLFSRNILASTVLALSFIPTL